MNVIDNGPLQINCPVSIYTYMKILYSILQYPSIVQYFLLYIYIYLDKNTISRLLQTVDVLFIILLLHTRTRTIYIFYDFFYYTI